jgi:hypothetical protein
MVTAKPQKIVTIVLSDHVHGILAAEAKKQNRSTRAQLSYLLDQAAAGIEEAASRSAKVGRK